LRIIATEKHQFSKTQTFYALSVPTRINLFDLQSILCESDPLHRTQATIFASWSRPG
jgi:hypothetical protein